MGKVTYTKDKELDPSPKINGKFPVGFNESKIGPILLLSFAHNSTFKCSAFNDFEKKEVQPSE